MDGHYYESDIYLLVQKRKASPESDVTSGKRVCSQPKDAVSDVEMPIPMIEIKEETESEEEVTEKQRREKQVGYKR